MTETELHDLLAKWLPAKWKYTPGEMESVRKHAGDANPAAFDREMARMMETRETTFKMAVTFILGALKTASGNSHQLDTGECATAEQFRVTMTLCVALTTAHEPAAKVRAYGAYLDERRRIGWDMAPEDRARLESEMRRLLEKADAATDAAAEREAIAAGETA